MKKLMNVFLVALLMVAVACNDSRRGNDSDMAYDNDDSKERADEANAEKFEDNDVEDDADWVSKTVEKNYGEIQLATLATQQSQNPEVKRIAQMLVDHHTKTLNELKTLAQSKSYSIPTEAGDDVMRKSDRFRNEAGEDFDKRWCREMIDMHEESIKDFEKKAENAQDAEVRTLANKTLPVLRSHLDQLEACEERLDDGNA